ncbi:HB2A protein, partial [Peucedramus taeniatus]|nr:HB2A protein [Peucedramus taeniatus]
PSMSISLVPWSSQASPRCLLCSVMNFHLAQVQVRWFQGQQEVLRHVFPTNVIVSNADWTHQLLVLLETSPSAG